MGSQRNGARTFLEILKSACRLSHLPGFRSGLGRILGPAAAEAIYDLWLPFCALVELTIASDDHFNRVDALSPSLAGGEDTILV